MQFTYYLQTAEALNYGYHYTGFKQIIFQLYKIGLLEKKVTPIVGKFHFIMHHDIMLFPDLSEHINVDDYQ